MAEQTFIDSGHVFYFEPTDIDSGSDQDGNSVSLMPHFEDFCIAMTLTAEVYPRKKDSIETVSNRDNSQVSLKSISWVSYATDIQGLKKENQQIVNGGFDVGDENFLTTYYTEISADRYVENEILEGLGVTSVDISYESWYTPTITIKFVDVHGSSLWGREEAIHDSNDNITSNNVLGVFFTQPYPLFRLQIKGFLGHDITYQLTVSSFKGKYNSNTGNFEATATFIGYSYSLLTDIPIQYLAYVSEMTYVGKQYWDDHVNTTEWQMVNADNSRTPPIPLYKLIYSIKSAVEALSSKNSKNCDGSQSAEKEADGTNGDVTSENNNVTSSKARIVRNSLNDKNAIIQIEEALTNFETAIKNCSENYIYGQEGKSKQLLLFVKVNSNQKFNINKSCHTSYVTLSNAIDEYNKSNTENKLVNGIKAFDKVFNDELLKESSSSLSITAYNILTVYKDKNNANKVGFTDRTVKDYKNIKFGVQTRKLYQDTANKLKSLCEDYNSGKNNSTTYRDTFPTDYDGKVYAYLLPLGQMWSNISNLKAYYEKASINIQTEEETKVASQSNSSEPRKKTKKRRTKTKTDRKKIIDMIGFEPTIGNFVKLVMCHLETFAEVMMHCGEKIYTELREKKRTYSYLGVDNEYTDITNDSVNVWPWPALYRPDYEENSETTAPYDGKYAALGWPNDYEDDDKNTLWEEKEVILSIMDAIRAYSSSTNGAAEGIVRVYDMLPISGSDLSYSTSPFTRISGSCNTIEKLSPYLGLRIANVIGVADHNCTASDAEAIGYMDAVNMISSTNDYSSLKNAITSNGNDKVFSNQVINYLTCSSSVKPTNMTDSGNSYNSYETIRAGSGNVYDNNRHPMFKKDESSGNYKYTYIYTSPVDGSMVPVSLVPTQLWKFDGTNNPYADMFSGQSYSDTDNLLSYSFTPTINSTKKSGSTTGVSQDFVYTANTGDFVSDSDIESYTNEQLFYIVNSVGRSSNIIDEIEAFKNGDVKYKNYAIEGESSDNLLKKFFDRRYDIMGNDEYYGKYNGYVSYAAPMSQIDEDYFNDHLCESSKEKDDVTYNDNWISSSKSDLYTKYQNSAKENKTNNSDNVVIAELPIRINDSDFSLFGTKLYFQQNNISGSDSKLREKCKAYLILTSMVSGIEKYTTGLFSNSTNTSIIQNVHPCYVYFIGALLWRKQYYDSYGEPLYLNGYNNIPSSDCSFIRKSDNRFYIGTGTQRKTTWLSIKDYLTDYESIDISVKNKLINLFENFVNGSEFKKILSYCELTKTDEDDDWNSLKEKWTKSSFDSSSPSQWTNIFSNIFGNYSSIVVPNNKSGLRLLFSENNEAIDYLNELFGLSGGFLIGRGTAERIGTGDNEIIVTSEQMKGYLKGFEERINDLDTTATTNKEEKSNNTDDECDRDAAISMYYSLKQLWDAWLVAAKRDQFTIGNFFNKYFIFMDSFYINMYNTIKLNCQTILDAYNTKDINVLNFIERVAAEQRCMFFSIPNFIDSNNMSGNLSTVKSYNATLNSSTMANNFKKIFTPLTFNEMGTPQTSNVFIFIYTHPFSDSASESNGKKYDSYSMNNQSTWPAALNKETNTFADGTSEDDELVYSRVGYRMPCFGVTVNRGNNYIFKGINVSMDSPKVTAISAQTMEDILIKNGRDGGKRVFFHGQDIYKIYSQYAYTCEIEMIGCAQVQPLMYFQLLNMPMWRGTYMIYKVTHSMQPGMMATKFVGIKMSKYQAPPATGYYTEAKSVAQKSDTSSSSGGSNSGSSSSSCSTDGNGKWLVGGDAMIKNIFKNYTNYSVPTNGEYFNDRTNHKHGGVDLSCPKNTPLYAPWDGKIHSYKTKDDGNGGGNRIRIVDESGKYLVIYMHCESFKVTSGNVKAGDLIAYSGNTGHNARNGKSINPHLHLELHIAKEANKFNFSSIPANTTEASKTTTHVNPLQQYGYIGSTDS